MKNIILTFVFSVTTAINSFASDWDKADIGAIDDYQTDDGSSIWVIVGIIAALYALVKFVDKDMD